MSDPIEVLDFWLGDVGADGWYAAGDDLDAEVREEFLDLWQSAAGGGLDHWVEGTVGTLAFIILCDQLSRNMHRGKAEAFATDAAALAAARLAVAEGWDLNAPEPERQFFYMPFEHSENPEDQVLAVGYMAERMPNAPDLLHHALVHRAIIARFGRFPARNAALGRDSTAEEAAFLAEGGYGALLREIQQSHAPGA